MLEEEEEEVGERKEKEVKILVEVCVREVGGRERREGSV